MPTLQISKKYLRLVSEYFWILMSKTRFMQVKTSYETITSW
jgi:hypothetical protein